MKNRERLRGVLLVWLVLSVGLLASHADDGFAPLQGSKSSTITGGTFAGTSTFTGVAKFPDGTVAAPSVTFTNDPDCGLYRIGANNFAVSVNGLKRKEWSSTQSKFYGTTGTVLTTIDDTGTMINNGIFGYSTGFLVSTTEQVRLGARTRICWSTATNVNSANADCGWSRSLVLAGTIRADNGGPPDTATGCDVELSGLGATNGQALRFGSASELLVLNTGGVTSDTTANLLPANAVIYAVSCRVTTTITTATDWSVGTSAAAARFSAANSTLTSGTTSVGLDHWATGTQAQTAAAPIRITTTGTPGAGAIRITAHYVVFTAAGS